MKKKALLTITTVLLITPIACDDVILSVEEKAQKASAEFCECMKKNTLSKCEDELNSSYSYYSNNNDFIKAFNNANKCGATISKK
jgi:hypothetical protein